MFIDVLLPLAVPPLTYQVPLDLIPQIGLRRRVIVPIKKKFYTAIVYHIHDIQPAYETKDIATVLDKTPIINDLQIQFWEWIAAYYMCTLGEVYKAALPAGLKLESETVITLNPEFEAEIKLSPVETLLIEELKTKKQLSLEEVKSVTERKTIVNLTRNLLEKGLILINEKVEQGYKPKYEIYIRLCEHLYQENDLKEAFQTLAKSPKALQVLMTFIQMADFFNKGNIKEIRKKDLLEKTQATSTLIKTLIEKNIFDLYKKEISRLHFKSEENNSAHNLNEYQQTAYNQILTSFEKQNVCLLFGVTSSGKTEIYIRLINDYLQQGKQILYLLPEIALTTQIINRLRKIFGNEVGVYHSKFNDSERVEIWNNVLETTQSQDANLLKYKIILGVRSSVFMPFANLGLIIIDEEHETTFKQNEPAPRYHARDAAMVLARQHGAKVLLGTATPSLESYFNAQAGKYGLVELNQRYQDIELPEIEVVNIKAAVKKDEMKSHFTPYLLEKMQEALNNKEQIILFQNRRGFSPFVECNTCGWIPRCERCDVNLTYHKHNNSLTCHYCAYTITNPHTCLACGDVAMQTRGFGTEKIEDEIPLFLPDAKVARMDLDTTRSKKSYETIISEFEDKKIDILVGTQMITKGLDFDNVSLVGILNADTMLNFPDFRAFERSYQLMTQVSGRAGRKGRRGLVIIQTNNPQHIVIENVIKNDYQTMYTAQMNERSKFHYPPFYRLILITLKHRNETAVETASFHTAELLRQLFADRVLGPESPSIYRLQNFFQKNILLKIEKEKSAERAKQLIHKVLERIKPAYPSLIVNINVDPV